VLLFYIGGYWLIKTYETNKKEYYYDFQASLLKSKYDTSFKYLNMVAKDIVTMYSQNNKLLKILENANRCTDKDRFEAMHYKAYNLLKRKFKRLKNMGISSVQFHLPNNKCFLRLNKPYEFGDDLSKRFSIAAVGQSKEPKFGLEVGKYSLGYRFVYPLFNKKNEFLGSVEISYAVEGLIKEIIDYFVLDSHFLISKKIINNSLFSEELKRKYEPTWESEDYLIDILNHNKLNNTYLFSNLKSDELKSKIEEGIKKGETFVIPTIYNYHYLILSYLPIQGINGEKNIAYLVTYNNSDFLEKIDVEINYIILLYYSISTLLFILIAYFIYNREKLKQLALYDNLTKIPNRVLFMIELQNEINRAQRYNYKLALLFMDLDGFKAVNDTYGHHVGDKLLVAVTDTVLSTIRKVDIFSRFGGDEFALLLNSIRNEDDALLVANNIIKNISLDITINEHKVKVGASIGIALYPDHFTNIDAFVKLADSAMYEAKKRGKNQAVIHKPNL
jgi:diguanylate cyclase (GGDEF)-like protein